MKVLVVAGVFPPTPLAEANHALHLAEALAERGVEVEVLTTEGAVTVGFPFRVHAVMPNWSWRTVPRFVRLVRQAAPDAILMVYIGFAFGDHPMTTFAPTIVKRARPGTWFVTQFENVMGAAPYQVSLIPRIIRKLATFWAGTNRMDYEFGTLLRDSDRIIVLGGQHRAALEERQPGLGEKTDLIPPPPIIRVCSNEGGVARARGRAQLGLGPDDFVLTYFGYLYPNKGLETLLDAFHRVRAGGRRARLVIAGGIPAHLEAERAAYVDQLKSQAETLGLQKDVTWTGFLSWDRDEASLYLHAADVCVLPFDVGVSLNNSTVAAAAAHGRPIITTRGELVEPAFRPGENVLLCPSRDPVALASAIAATIDDAALRDRLSQGAEELRRQWFSWDRATTRIIEALTPSS